MSDCARCAQERCFHSRLAPRPARLSGAVLRSESPISTMRPFLMSRETVVVFTPFTSNNGLKKKGRAGSLLTAAVISVHSNTVG